MIEIVKSGGPMMIPLLLASIIGVAIFLERLYSLRRKNIIPEPVINAIYHLKNESDVQSLKSLCHSHPGVLSDLVLECLENRDLSLEELKDYMEDQGRHAIRYLQRGLGGLEAVGTTAPLMGLLGTIFGMIKVFDTIKTMGVGQAKALSGGISEALITTATGLVIAIPILLVYYFLNGRTEDLILQIEKNLIILINKLNKIND
ncbi:MAG: MotA/TolQ/ExbB proton channel family protein [Calditrichia bacterium]